MKPFWPWEVVERDHQLQNPTSPDKIRLLGEYLRLSSDSRVLDVACGKGGPAAILAETFGCRVSGIELRPAFAEEARRRAAAAGLDSLIDVRTADAASADLGKGFDAALCLGASFVWGTVADAAAALRPAVAAGGSLAVGEPFWRTGAPPGGHDAEGFVGLAETVSRFEGAGVRLTGLVASSEDDWDRYESLHWRAIEEWLAEHPDDPRTTEFRAGHERARGHYLGHRRAHLGWAILVGRVDAAGEPPGRATGLG